MGLFQHPAKGAMMLKIFSLLVIVAFSAVTVDAAIYSCRDKEGRLFMSDNLQELPAECRGQTQTVESNDPDNLNYVPAQKVPRGAGAEFQQTVRDAERKQQQKQARVDRWLVRAAQLAEQYRQAVQEKSNATRRWSYSSRDIIQKADERIEKAREGKQRLLAEMADQKISRGDKKKIVSRLSEIVD